MFKRIIGILCAIAILTTASAVVFAEDSVATISTTSAAAKVGETVDIEVIVAGNPGIAMALLEVDYDNKALKLTKVKDAGLWGDTLHSPNLTSNPYKLFWNNPLVTENYTANGTIATLTFEVLHSAKAMEYPITVRNVNNKNILDVNLEKVIFEIVSGKVTVEGSSSVADSEEETEIVKPDEKPSEEEMTSQERKKDVICLVINKSLTISYGEKKNIDDNNPLVVPYINNDRTMVPLRYISEALNAEVLWEEGWDGCIIKKGDKEIEFTFGSAEFTVNGKKYTYEAPIEMLHDRTMVPVRFISEHLDCNVYWESINGAVIISPKDNPWVPERKAEIAAANEMLLTIFNLV